MAKSNIGVCPACRGRGKRGWLWWKKDCQVCFGLGLPTRLSVIKPVTSDMVLVVEVEGHVPCDDGLERLRMILMDRLPVRDVLICCDGVKLAGVYELIDLAGRQKPTPPPNVETRDGDPAPK